MMLNLITLSLLHFLGFVNSTNQSSSSSTSIKYLHGCTVNQTQMVQTAILACELVLISNSTVCIRSYIQTNYSGQTWNVFVKNTMSNLDTISFWYLNNCVFELYNFGTLNRSYIIWRYDFKSKTIFNSQDFEKQKSLKAEPSAIDSRMKARLNSGPFQEQEDKQNYEEGSQSSAPNCPMWKNTTAKLIMTACDLPLQDHSANCITERIKNEIGDYWNAYVGSTSNSAWATYYQECAITVKTFGKYSRTINVWRTVSVSDS